MARCFHLSAEKLHVASQALRFFAKTGMALFTMCSSQNPVQICTENAFVTSMLNTLSDARSRNPGDKVRAKHLAVDAQTLSRI